MTLRSVGSRFRVLSLAVCFVLLAASCQATTQVAEGDRGADASGQGNGDASGAPQELSSADVYRSVVDSVVYIETPDRSSGTGIVIEGGWILTNAHVVDRFAEVTIGRSDGVDLGEHPVHGIDWIFDLALVGPVDDASLVAMERVPSADLAIGERVLLVGFPDESSIDPTPTLTEGIVSRRRQPVLGNFPFLQVDATIAPGQSGGALIDGRGQLVGISGLEFGEGEFGLAFEADAMWPRIDVLQATGSVLTPTGEPVFELSGDIGPRRTFGFTIEVDADGVVDLLAESPDDIYIDLQSLGGVTVSDFSNPPDYFATLELDTQYYVDDLVEGGEQLTADVEPGTYQVIVGTFGGGQSTVDIQSSNPLRPFDDVEEEASLPVGEVVEGEFDWPRDSDKWLLSLTEGESVTITTDGIADTILAIRLDGEVVDSNDDEGLGLFGTGSRVEFVAEETGVYEVEVGTFDDTRWGYLIEVTIE